VLGRERRRGDERVTHGRGTGDGGKTIATADVAEGLDVKLVKAVVSFATLVLGCSLRAFATERAARSPV